MVKRNQLPINPHDWFEYIEGKLYWKEISEDFFANPKSAKSFNSKHMGQRAGRLNKGYREVGIQGKKYPEHRIIFQMFNGYAPDYVDHIDGNTQNNMISNLREATNSLNQANAKMRHDNSSGVKGVTWHKKAKKWQASITIHGKKKHLGLFDRLEDAQAIREQAAVDAFDDYIDHNR